MKKSVKKFFVKFVVLALVFLAGLTGTVILLDNEKTDNRGDLNPPSLPEVMMSVDGVVVNRMYGYKQKMQVDFTRDSLTPLDTGKELNFVVNPYEAKVKSLAYEIRTSDGSRVLENKKIKSLTEVNGYLKAAASVESSMLMNQEYSLQISLETEEGTYYYYNRIIQRSNVNAGIYVKFARDFSEQSMDKTTAESLARYMETEDAAADINFAKVDIRSPWDAVSWGDLKPKVTLKGIPTIKDINETTGSVTLDYQITAQNEQGQDEVYDVTEFYRMRYAAGTISLLDFERSARQVFDGELPVVTEEGLILGVRDREVNYLTDEDVKIVAFVQEGDLWTYAPDDQKLTRIFSFRKDKKSDFRDVRDEHDVKIVRVDADGNVDFVLYGYMNRGSHEGYSGVSVCHYNSDQNVIEERVFIPSTESYEFLKEDLGTLSYVNEENQLFLLFAGKLYQVDIEGRHYETLEEGLSAQEFFVSETNAHAAWLADGDRMKEIDFDTGKTRLMEAGDGQRLEILGYFNEDVVYGLALEENILKDVRGNDVIAKSVIQIEDFDGNAKKTYQPGYLITDVTMGGTMMEMQLCEKNGDSYTFVKKDNIMNSRKAAANQISLELTYEGRRGVLIRMAFPEDLDEEEPLVVTAKNRLTDQVVVSLDTSVPQDDMYYVYARGHLDSVYQNPAEAIIRADERTGVVLNRAQQYVWERGNRRTSIQLTVENIPEIFRQGILDTGALQEALGDTGTVLDLTGCSLDSILYQISSQRPVIVKTGENETKVIVGYDEYNTWLYTPATGETKAFAMDDSEELFSRYGNVFVTYMENLES